MERMFDALSLHPPGSYTPQAAARAVTPQEWRPSRLRSSPPPTEPRRTSYTPGPADESFPEEEEEDWEPPTRSVGGRGHPQGRRQAWPPGWDGLRELVPVLGRWA